MRTITPEEAARYLKIAIIVIILFIVIPGAFYTVQPDEAAIVLRFGKYLGTYGPGLHFKIPFGVDSVQKVTVKRIRTEEFGFRTKKAGVKTIYEDRLYQDESLMLTGDLNIADVEWIVQYRVANPTDYFFNIRNKEKNLRDVSESAMRLIVGDRSIDEVLTIGRAEIEVEVKRLIQTILDSYKMGVEIVMVKLQNVTPPDPVGPSFNEVNEARQEKERMINEALAQYNKTIPRVTGEAQQRISQAEGYAIDVVNSAHGDVAKFLSMLKEYRKAPVITRTRLYLEAMEDIYQKAGEKYIVDPELKNLVPLLNLNKGASEKK